MFEYYRSPITTLYDDIVGSLSNSSLQMSKRLEELIESKRLSRRIVINAERLPIKFPEANMETGEIHLQDAHIAYVWCIAYLLISIIVINDEKARLGYTVVNIGESTERDELNRLIEWARSLSTLYSNWRCDIPKPTDNAHRILQANQVTTDALRYLIYHEVAHIANKHKSEADLVKKIKCEQYKPTEDELSWLKQVETEADNYAFDCLFLTEDSEEEKYLKMQGAIVAHLSNLYLQKDSDTRGFRHPDLDVRLYNLMGKVKFDNIVHDVYIKHTVNVGLQLYFHIVEVPYIDHNGYDEFEEQTAALFNLIDQEKHKHTLRETKNF